MFTIAAVLGVAGDLASFGAAGIMGGMWLWERKTSRQRDEQLTESHERILRDEERLSKLTQVVEQNTAAISRFTETQRQADQTLRQMIDELRNARSVGTRD